MTNRIDSIDPLDESSEAQNNADYPNDFREMISGGEVFKTAVKGSAVDNTEPSSKPGNISDQDKARIDKESSNDSEDLNENKGTLQETEINKNNSTDNQVDNDNVVKKSESSKWKSFVVLFFKFFVVYLDIFCLYMGACSIYWGSYYRRNHRYTNLKMAVVSDDTSFNVNGTTIEPLVENAFIDMVTKNESIKTLGGWEIQDHKKFSKSAQKHNNTNLEELSRQIHHQRFWVGVYIAPNTTQKIHESIANANSSIISSGEISELVNIVYESGRHFSALNQYVTKNLNEIELAWLNNYVGQQVYDVILSQYLTDSERKKLVKSSDTMSLINTKPVFNFVDNKPSHSSAVLGPSELGLIYAYIFSFHQFNFSLEIHASIKNQLKYKHYLIYRILASQVNYLVLSLVYGLITLAFQVPTGVAFGKSGFLVLWMFVYLYISAAGGVNENVVTVILTYDKKKFIAPWIIISMILNMAPTFSPMALTPGFYRYGYAMPMFNAYEALKVVFFDTWKGHLGRHLGILIVWIVLLNISLVLLTNWNSKVMKQKQAQALKEGEQKEKLKESQTGTTSKDRKHEPIYEETEDELKEEEKNDSEGSTDAR